MTHVVAKVNSYG